MRATLSSLSILFAAGVLCASPGVATAQERYDQWERLVPNFPSTGGGGIMIGEYRPVVQGAICSTDFTATTPEGTVYRNHVVFDALPVQGGILCTNGRWKALDGDATGTTPFRVFFKDGIALRAP